ncbi:MAG: hypothetical protein R2876_04210 [Eubacteriales bacterium]
MDQPEYYNCNFFLQGLPLGCEATMTTLIAEILAEGLSSVQIKAFANFFTSIGVAMAYIGFQKDLSTEFKNKCLDNEKRGVNYNLKYTFVYCICKKRISC